MATRLLCAVVAMMTAGVALAPAAGAQTQSTDASLRSLLIESDLGQTRMFPAFDPAVDRYNVAVPSGETEVTVKVATNYPEASVVLESTRSGRCCIDELDYNANTGAHTLELRTGGFTYMTVTVTAEDGSTTREYRLYVDIASSDAKGWRVYNDVPMDRLVDDSRLPSHYVAGVWADDSRVFVTGRRNDPFDQKLFAFNAADSTRQTADEFVIGGDAGIWSDGTKLWSMDSDGNLRAYNLSDGSEDASLRADVSPDGYYDTREVAAPRGIWSDGSTLWVLDRENTKVFAFALPGPNCSNHNNYCRQSAKDFDLHADNDEPWGITAGKSSPTATEIDTFWVTNVTDDRSRDKKLYAYHRSDDSTNGSRKSALDIDLKDTLKLSSYQQFFYGLAATDTIMYVSEYITGRVFSFSMPGVSGPVAPALISSDATLSSLSLSNFTFPTPPMIFTPEQTFYTVEVDNDVTSTKVTATPTHGAASYAVNKNDIYDDDGVIPLDEGTNTITVVVTAADGRTTKLYTVVVERLRLSDDATLSALTLSGVDPQDLGFSAATEGYRVDVASSSTSTTVTATPNNGDATVEIDGVEGTVRTVDVMVGETEIEVLVTAADGTTKTYTVTVARERAKSDNAMLNDMRLMYGDEEAQLTPGFASDEYAYMTSLAHGVSSVLVKYELSDTNAEGVEMRIGGAKDNNGVVANEGVVTLQAGVVPSVDLLVGVNTLTVEVTAENGTDTHAYEVSITRAEASNVATLESLSVDPGELMRQGGAVGGFDPGVALYETV